MIGSLEENKVTSQTAFIDRLLPAPIDGGFRMEDYWVWCGSVIRGDDGLYHMFASRWRKRYPFFEGYIIESEIVRAVSPTPEGPYTFREVVLPERGAQFWDGRMKHNPTIHKLGDTYLLFYIGSTYTGPKPAPEEITGEGSPIHAECYANVRIGLATAKSPAGPWECRPRPILEPRPGKWDAALVTNPAVCITPEGEILLYYRSNTPQGLRIGLAKAKDAYSPFERVTDEPVLKLSDGNHVEDPFVWFENGCYQMIAKDMTGGITGEKHAGIHATSPDGISWQVSNPPKAYSRRIRWNDGTETIQGALERPQLLLENGRPTHLFAATGDGPGGYRASSQTWNMVIPLKSS